MTAADRLRAAREAAGYRSARLAAAAMGIGYSTYLGHENGQNGFTADQAEVYAKAFGVTGAHLMFGDSDHASVARLVDLLVRKGIVSDDEAHVILGTDAGS
jgi:hypothetical protein